MRWAVLNERVRRCWPVREPRVAMAPEGDLTLTQCGDGDGAWFVHAPSIERGGLCYAFGIGTDISFDRAVIERFGLTVHAFDPTPLSREWLARQETPDRFHAHPWGLGAEDGPRAFVLPTHHGVSYTPLPYEDHRAVATCDMLRLSTMRERLGHAGMPITLLKLDIEGGEYAVIDQLVADLRITQILIEFHHRLSPGGVRDTEAAALALRAGGFRAIHRSPRGQEYVFLRG